MLKLQVQKLTFCGQQAGIFEELLHFGTLFPMPANARSLMLK